ncbi:MAG: hypothetical protein HY290_09775 [Planctomycetia bacterium]|nr:hypothetical protein [Planctomycetia bacterium]
MSRPETKKPESSGPESIVVTCLTCHERIGVSLAVLSQVIRCTFCEAPVHVPSREEVRRQEAERRQAPAPKNEEYAIAAADAPPPESKPLRAGAEGKSQRAVPTISLECPTCHELIKARVGPKPGKTKCTFCEAPISIPDQKTVEKWRAAEVKPRSAGEIGEYASGPVPESLPPRPTTVFDRISEIRQEAIPDPPRWTFFSGVFNLPWQSQVLVRWIYMSIGFTAIVGIGIVLKGLAAQFSGFSAGVAIAFFLMPIIWLVFFTVSYSSACSLHVLESTAAGLDQIEAWPEPNWRDWMAEMMYLGWIAAIPAAISYGVALLAATKGVPVFITVPSVLFVIYPISLLSALEANSIWVPLTLPIVKSLFRWWWCWLLFYGLAGLVIGGLVAGATYLIVSSLDGFLLALGPLLAAAPLIYFRLLGRLAWRMTTKVKRKAKKNHTKSTGEA